MNHRIVTRLLIPLTLAGMLLTGCGDAPQGGRAQSNPIVIENQNPGTQDWLLTKVDTVLSTEGPGNQPHYLRSRKIEGYTSRTSYATGDTVTLFVSMDPAGDFTIDFYRMGYYQGNGGRHMRSDGPLPGITQPTPEDGQRNLREAGARCRTSGATPGIRREGTSSASTDRTGSTSTSCRRTRTTSRTAPASSCSGSTRWPSGWKSKDMT